MVDFTTLIEAAHAIVGEFRSNGCVSAGGVGAAILSGSGEIFTGVCIDASCGIGFCAEHAAIAEMLKKRQTRILACVALGKDHMPIPPCGRCRDFMHQLSPENMNSVIMVSNSEVRTLRELLPNAWDYTK
jgi:cytidine deaminase